MAAKFSSGPTFRRRGSTFANRGRRGSIASPTPRRRLRLGSRGPGRRLSAMEPTGGYERALCSALAEAAFATSSCTPTRSWLFARPRASRAKTDLIDAMLIAQYLADAKARADLPFAFRADERLRALAARRRQLVDARQAEGCRADLASDPLVRESLAIVIAALTQSLEAIEEAIERHIAERWGARPPRQGFARGARRRSGRGRDAGRRPAGARPPDRQADRRPRRPRPPYARKRKKEPAGQNRLRKTACAQRLVQRRPGRHPPSFTDAATSTIVSSKPIVVPEKSP